MTTVFIAGSIKIKEFMTVGDVAPMSSIGRPWRRACLNRPGCFSAGDSQGGAMAQARGETRSGLSARAALETMARD